MRSSARFPEIPGLHRSTSSPTSRATRAGPGSRCRCRRNPRWAGSEDFARLRPASRRSSGRNRRRIQASHQHFWSSKRRTVAEPGRQRACAVRSADRASASDHRTTVVAWPSENGRPSKSPPMVGSPGPRLAGPAGWAPVQRRNSWASIPTAWSPSIRWERTP